MLSPAFDVNPNIDKAEHVLNIDDADNRPSIDLAISTSDFYGLDRERAITIAKEVIDIVGQWKEFARRRGLSNADIELTAGAFSALQNAR